MLAWLAMAAPAAVGGQCAMIGRYCAMAIARHDHRSRAAAAALLSLGLLVGCAQQRADQPPAPPEARLPAWVEHWGDAWREQAERRRRAETLYPANPGPLP